MEWYAAVIASEKNQHQHQKSFVKLRSQQIHIYTTALCTVPLRPDRWQALHTQQKTAHL